MKSIVIAGSLAQKPGSGGHTWVFLQYLLGFRKLGWDVLFLDRLESTMCRDEAGRGVPLAESWNLAYFLDVMRRFSLDGSYGLLCDGEPHATGLSRDAILERVRRSSALINVMGFLDDEEILTAAPTRVFLDIDPGFGQMWQALGLHETFRGHDTFVTIGENIGHPTCTIPTCGLNWITTRQPVVLDEWPVVATPGPMRGPITTVATWRGAFAPVEYQGTTYGLRAHEFRKFASLPQLVDREFRIALDIHPNDSKDSDLLASHGWVFVAPQSVAGDPWRYRDFIRESAAEIMIAKGMYVQAHSGWFSDRSICYLASGRPVIAQDTGLQECLPAGEGVLTFSTLDEAVEATRAVGRDYARHARAARRMAEELFDSSTVLRRLVAQLRLS
jgi:hypothetical protein